MTIKVPQRIEERLTAEATRRGLDVSSFVVELIDSSLPPATGSEETLKWLRRWEEENATDDPEEIERGEKELQALKEGLNRNRLEMEGPNSRKIFP